MYNISFENKNGYRSAKEIIDEQCEYLKKDSGDLIFGKADNYSCEIEDYIRRGNKNPIRLFSSLFEDENIDIQNDLGELSDGNFTYDLYLSSKHTPNYKYRVMFFRYGIGGYPVQIVLDEDIAVTIDVSTKCTCNNEEELKKLLEKIFSSTKFAEVITNLFSYNKKIESDVF